MKLILTILIACCIMACLPASSACQSKPWKQSRQSIPGRIQCELYDKGGEGITWHDADSINNGSGKLNPVNGNPLHEFRMKEGVDISYTKTHDIDNNPYNKVMPDSNQLYVGWTEPGEWIKYTIDVKETGRYRIRLMYTANGDGAIALDIDGKPSTETLKISSTYNASDSIAWRQWHHWNKSGELTTVEISKGIHTLTLRIVEHGNMNFDYIEFTKK
jgi:hypothetical protein